MILFYYSRQIIGRFKMSSSYKHRFNFLLELVESFRKRLSREVSPSLVIHPKWHTDRRNIIVGDVLLYKIAIAYQSFQLFGHSGTTDNDCTISYLHMYDTLSVFLVPT